MVAALILAERGLTAPKLAKAAGLSLRSVVECLDRLESSGLVGKGDGGYIIVDEAFVKAARNEAPPTPPSAYPDHPPEEARVLDQAFVDGRLAQWPAKRSKRRIVLDHLSQEFDIGTRFAEAEVNERLSRFTDDIATMRRYLVDEQFLDRSDGEYWRCGGAV